MIVDLPHIGRWNIDRIVRVTAHAAKWHHGSFRPKARRQYIWWGKPYRDRDPWDYLEPASIRVWSGSDYGDYVGYACKPGEPVRWRDEVLASIAAAQAAPQAERIVAAAIRRLEANRASVGDADQTAWMTYSMPAPARHHHILYSMPAQNSREIIGPSQQGFLTSTGRWVSRKEAMGIAVAAGQVPPSKVTAPDLFSEDLW